MQIFEIILIGQSKQIQAMLISEEIEDSFKLRCEYAESSIEAKADDYLMRYANFVDNS